MDIQIKKFNKEIKKIRNKIEKLFSKIEEKQSEQYEYQKNKELFNVITKLQDCNLLEDNIFVYFVNHRKIMNVLFSELIYYHKFNQYILGGERCDHIRCMYKFRFNDKNLYIPNNGNGYWCSDTCYHYRKHL
jgi:hypothetical protein